MRTQTYSTNLFDKRVGTVNRRFSHLEIDRDKSSIRIASNPQFAMRPIKLFTLVTFDLVRIWAIKNSSPSQSEAVPGGPMIFTHRKTPLTIFFRILAQVVVTIHILAIPPQKCLPRSQSSMISLAMCLTASWRTGHRLRLIRCSVIERSGTGRDHFSIIVYSFRTLSRQNYWNCYH